MIVLDASVLIGHLDSNDPHHSRARALLEASGGSALGVSSVSLAETLVAPARSGRLEEAQEALDRIGIAELRLGVDAAAELASLRANTGCKLPDCCVLLAAKEYAGRVASFDADLTQAAKTLGLDLI